MNDDFEIIGVIDVDGVMAAPIEVVAQNPPLTGLERDMLRQGHLQSTASKGQSQNSKNTRIWQK